MDVPRMLSAEDVSFAPDGGGRMRARLFRLCEAKVQLSRRARVLATARVSGGMAGLGLRMSCHRIDVARCGTGRHLRRG